MVLESGLYTPTSQEINQKIRKASAFGSEDLAATLGLNSDEWIGKRVLDIGSGPSDLVFVLRELGVNAFGIDLGYTNVPAMVWEAAEIDRASRPSKLMRKSADRKCIKDREERDRRFRESMTNPEEYVAGDALNLPINGDMADAVIMSRLIVEPYGSYPEMVDKMLSEALRVTRANGSLYVGPYFYTNETVTMVMLDRKLRGLHAAGCIKEPKIHTSMDEKICSFRFQKT